MAKVEVLKSVVVEMKRKTGIVAEGEQLGGGGGGGGEDGKNSHFCIVSLTPLAFIIIISLQFAQKLFLDDENKTASEFAPKSGHSTPKPMNF